ncbi:Mitotic checkpoint protein BUB3 [Toxocara canis]|uniref:Mitotic checkpoint protein BUB3 n=2 Tax=Toxocara canis TaxID=6265 RepID=A0A0B2V5Q1_TOXCA|nr:Mitotic checkpoint protein BUB3 [Toxocara canis]
MEGMFHFAAGSTEGTLPHPPGTQISKVQYGPDETSQLLAVSSWAGTVRIYHFPSTPVVGVERRVYAHTKAVLAFTFFSKNELVSGGLDCLIKTYDLEMGAECVMGRHDAAVRCIEYCEDHSLVVSGGWDSAMKLWDVRSKGSAGFANNGDKVYAMDTVGNRVVVGTKERRIIVWDVRKLGEPEQVRDSPLKYQTRAVKCFPMGDAFVVSSIEGRVAVEYFDLSPEVQKNKYAFKCHREKDKSGTELIYPVNCLAFHPVHNTFVTGGSDALVNIWDPFNRKRICQLHKFPTSIMSVSFNPSGSQLAIAASYMNELKEGPATPPESCVVVRRITDVEARPK